MALDCTALPLPKVHWNQLPDDLRHFPRDDYSYAQYHRVEFRGADPTPVYLAAGARAATRAWVSAVETGSWTVVNERCFTLAVLDKAIQLNWHARHNIWDPWPPRITVDHWRQLVGNTIELSYELAIANAGPLDAPPLDRVRETLMPPMQWFHSAGDSAHRYPWRKRPTVDVEQVCGEFMPQLRKEKEEDGLSKPFARLHL